LAFASAIAEVRLHGMIDDDSLWRFSLRVYALPGVADACLALQGRRGLDVNLLLWCGWRAALGGGVSDAADLRQAIGLTEPWQTEIVRPLRSVRQALKPRSVQDSDAAALRDEVKRLELDSEYLEQRFLARLDRWACDASRSLDDRGHDAALSMTAYLGLLGLDPDDADRQDIAVIAAACISGINPREDASGSV